MVFTLRRVSIQSFSSLFGRTTWICLLFRFELCVTMSNNYKILKEWNFTYKLAPCGYWQREVSRIGKESKVRGKYRQRKRYWLKTVGSREKEEMENDWQENIGEWMERDRCLCTGETESNSLFQPICPLLSWVDGIIVGIGERVSGVDP